MKTKAFTLVEIMIVVAIMGLLAALILPHVLTFRAHDLANKARTRHISDMHVINSRQVTITFAGETSTTNLFGQAIPVTAKEETETYTWEEVQDAQKFYGQSFTNLETPLHQ